MTKRIVVCGDDFGMNAGIDRAMISLADLGRLSAVSCLTLAPTFVRNAPALISLDVDVGVHINFSETFANDPAQMPALRSLILRAYTGKLDITWIDAQLERQFDAFEHAFGRAPDYVDGHQHVHQLPGIRPRVLALLRRRYGLQLPWVRQTTPGSLAGLPFSSSVKARVIGALGASALSREARLAGVPTNRRLLGVYGFDGGTENYAELLQQWLQNAHDGDLLMCHPSSSLADNTPMSKQRCAEFEILSGPAMGTWLMVSGVQVGRLTASAQGMLH